MRERFTQRHCGTRPHLIDRHTDTHAGRIDEIALDSGGQLEEPPLRLSDVSVFHNQGEGEPYLDFGDAPDPTYPTYLVNNGARHVAVPGVYMGALIDVEADGQPDAAATGDDLSLLDDEDGWVALGDVKNAGAVIAESATACLPLVPADWMVPLNAFLFAFGSVLLLEALARSRAAGVEGVVLFGIALVFTFNALDTKRRCVRELGSRYFSTQ